MNNVSLTSLFVYGVPTLLFIAWHTTSKRKKQRVARQVHAEVIRDGLVHPASLHPLIDPLKCIGCGACIAACPEQPLHHVLGLIGSKAELISPSDCIGHGACKTACPEDAIRLVFGTAERGVELPCVDQNFQSNVPGIFIAGELGGMGLIRNAIEQGKQAIDSIAGNKRRSDDQALDTLIVGAGPAGIAASLAATEKKLNFVTIEQESLGGTVAHYPRGKIVMTAPARLPLVGDMKFGETTKEALMKFWNAVTDKAKLRIHYDECLQEIVNDGKGFAIKTNKSSYRSRTVLLTIGRRGSPRKLGVPGEELPKVVYRLTDAAQYAGKKVVVVGGGDSALEAAISLAGQPGTKTILSYRSAALTRAKSKNRERLEAAQRRGNLVVLMNSNVTSITETSVEIEQSGKTRTVPNDAVIVLAGGILPTRLLESAGIRIETKYGTE